MPEKHLPTTGSPDVAWTTSGIGDLPEVALGGSGVVERIAINQQGQTTDATALVNGEGLGFYRMFAHPTGGDSSIALISQDDASPQFIDLATNETMAAAGTVSLSTSNVYWGHVHDPYGFVFVDDGIRVWDASDPYNPVELDTTGWPENTAAYPYDMTTTDDYVFLFYQEGWLHVWDWSDRTGSWSQVADLTFYETGNFPAWDKPHIHNGYCYLVGGGLGYVFDVSDPTAPSVAGTFPVDTTDETWMDFSNGNMVLTHTNKWEVWGLSDPTAPQLLFRDPIQFGGDRELYRVHYEHPYAYLFFKDQYQGSEPGVTPSRIFTFDLTDPGAPEWKPTRSRVEDTDMDMLYSRGEFISWDGWSGSLTRWGGIGEDPDFPNTESWETGTLAGENGDFSYQSGTTDYNAFTVSQTDTPAGAYALEGSPSAAGESASIAGFTSFATWDQPQFTGIGVWIQPGNGTVRFSIDDQAGIEITDGAVTLRNDNEDPPFSYTTSITLPLGAWYWVDISNFRYTDGLYDVQFYGRDGEYVNEELDAPANQYEWKDAVDHVSFDVEDAGTHWIDGMVAYF